MKRYCIIFSFILLCASIFCQVPLSFKYQAVARNTSGQIITNTQVNIQISIIKSNITGTSCYTETFNPTTNAFGLINLNIGNGIVVSGSFSDIDWGIDIYFIKVWLNGSEMGTSQLLSVPYALYAKKAETVANITITGDEIAFDGWDKNTSDDFDGNYINLIGKPLLSTIALTGSFSDLINKPVTLSGYGITDAMKITHPANEIAASNLANWNNAFSWGKHEGLYRTITWVPSWTDVTGKPAGNNEGDMLYWNGSTWVLVPVGQPGQFLQLNSSNSPIWAGAKSTLTTVAASPITNNSAISGGNITDDGGVPVTARGVCWSNSTNPTIADFRTMDGTGIGSYTSTISGLNAGATYYLRSYATNFIATAYGNEIIFTTTVAMWWE